jgi:transcriptional regulator GlxA family with amidase domain
MGNDSFASIILTNKPYRVSVSDQTGNATTPKSIHRKGKFNRLAEVENVKLLDDLCFWIDTNIDTKFGLKELVEKTNLCNSDLQYLFEKYKQTTPMTYIRHKRNIFNKVAKPTNFISPRCLSIS